MPCPPAKVSSMRLKKVRRSRKWLIGCPRLFGWLRGWCTGGGRRPAAPFDVAQQAAGPRVVPPGDGDAGQVEHQESPQRRLRPARQADRGAVALRDEEGAIGG